MERTEIENRFYNIGSSNEILDMISKSGLFIEDKDLFKLILELNEKINRMNGTITYEVAEAYKTVKYIDRDKSSSIIEEEHKIKIRVVAGNAIAEISSINPVRMSDRGQSLYICPTKFATIKSCIKELLETMSKASFDKEVISEIYIFGCIITNDDLTMIKKLFPNIQIFITENCYFEQNCSLCQIKPNFISSKNDIFASVKILNYIEVETLKLENPTFKTKLSHVSLYASKLVLYSNLNLFKFLVNTNMPKLRSIALERKPYYTSIGAKVFAPRIIKDSDIYMISKANDDEIEIDADFRIEDLDTLKKINIFTKNKNFTKLILSLKGNSILRDRWIEIAEQRLENAKKVVVGDDEYGFWNSVKQNLIKLYELGYIEELKNKRKRLFSIDWISNLVNVNIDGESISDIKNQFNPYRSEEKMEDLKKFYESIRLTEDDKIYLDSLGKYSPKKVVEISASLMKRNLLEIYKKCILDKTMLSDYLEKLKKMIQACHYGGSTDLYNMYKAEKEDVLSKLNSFKIVDAELQFWINRLNTNDICKDELLLLSLSLIKFNKIGKVSRINSFSYLGDISSIILKRKEDILLLRDSYNPFKKRYIINEYNRPSGNYVQRFKRDNNRKLSYYYEHMNNYINNLLKDKYEPFYEQFRHSRSKKNFKGKFEFINGKNENVYDFDDFNDFLSPGKSMFRKCILEFSSYKDEILKLTEEDYAKIRLLMPNFTAITTIYDMVIFYITGNIPKYMMKYYDKLEYPDYVYINDAFELEVGDMDMKKVKLFDTIFEKGKENKRKRDIASKKFYYEK